jgi:uncharacterized membrane protein YeaQ/YmgE (transglycosylase-associated protein family)
MLHQCHAGKWFRLPSGDGPSILTGDGKMQYIGMAIVGLIVGILARFFYPGTVHIGWIASLVLGIAGSYLAGFIGNLIHKRDNSQPFHPAGFVYSILGAMLIIFIARHLLHLV